jgi:RNA polymerase-binding protein
MPAIRGAGLSRSAYSDLQDLVEPAQTQAVTYRCPDGHVFTVRLFAEAETVPVSWDCRTCGRAARTEAAAAQEVPVPRRAGSASKTPWQQLRERRSIADLEALLEERLAVLRGTDPVEAA